MPLLYISSGFISNLEGDITHSGVGVGEGVGVGSYWWVGRGEGYSNTEQPELYILKFVYEEGRWFVKGGCCQAII